MAWNAVDIQYTFEDVNIGMNKLNSELLEPHLSDSLFYSQYPAHRKWTLCI